MSKGNFILFFVITVIFTTFCLSNTYSQTKYKGVIYDVGRDNYISMQYTRAYSGSGNVFVTKYTVYHPTKNYAWMTVEAKHDKASKTVNISVDDTNEGWFSHIRDEKINYETPSLEPFGIQGMLSVMGGKRIPYQLAVQFVSNKFENLKVAEILASRSSDTSSDWMFFMFTSQ